MNRTISGIRRVQVLCVGASLLLSAIFLASSAHAGSITYNIISNPQTDLTNSGNTVDLSGTITVSNSAGSPLGTFTSANDSTLTVSSDLTMTSSGPDNVTPVSQSGSTMLSSALTEGSVQLTSAGLFIVPSTTLQLQDAGGTLAPEVSVLWNPANSGEYEGQADAVVFNGFTMSFLNFNTSSYFVDGAWEIAAVPEPGALALFVFASALMGGISLLRLTRDGVQSYLLEWR